MQGLIFETLTALGPSNHLFIVVADAAWECCLHYFEALESQQLLHSVVIQAFQFAGSKHELARSQFRGETFTCQATCSAPKREGSRLTARRESSDCLQFG